MSYIEECAAAYEQEYGKRPSELVLKVAQHIDKVSGMLREQGRKEALGGEEPYSDEIFPALVRKLFRLDPKEESELVDSIAYVWREEYLEGYREVSA